MKRIFDILFAVLLGISLALPILIIGIMVKISSKGPVFHVSARIGKGNRIFKMIKFRTMIMDAPAVATHLLENPASYMTKIGSFLRKTSLDEIPQLWNIIKGDMSFVGPRPALFNQYDLKQMRTQRGIHDLMPGLTGWAQVNGRDELSLEDKVEMDSYYLRNRSLGMDLLILWRTLFAAISRRGAF